MPELFGIENLKKLIKFSCNLTAQITTALSDGKFKWTEIFGFIDEVMEIPGVVKSWPAINSELYDLSPEERQQLSDYVSEEFDIPDDAVEKFVENALMQAVSLIALVNEWKKIKKP